MSITATANGAPTKEFFVNMLTRDIALNDAILDLLDNCLDGVVRTKGIKTKKNDNNYYNGFYAKISITPTSFEIEDNCGGIPFSTAIDYAFRMGKTKLQKDDKLPTVGIYGIGMKRAIFKIGRNSEVITKTNENYYKVIIDDDWIKKEEDWGFGIEELTSDTSLLAPGTIIKINQLNDNIKNIWEHNTIEYVEDLCEYIQNSYSLIIEKGFNITVNGEKINSKPTTLLLSKSSGGMKPYIYTAKYGNVDVSLVIGFYANLISEEAIEKNNASLTRRNSENAGWTIICNDRVILYNDKTHLTGWGESGVPQYHTQFIGIRGIVTFESEYPEELPMTTTKRGIDLSSSIYADVKNKMREGLRMFTSYTNTWKGRLEEERKQTSDSKQEDVKLIIDKIKKEPKKFTEEYNVTISKPRSSPLVSDPKLIKPVLPRPENEKREKVIRYFKPNDEIEFLIRYFTEDDESITYTPSEIGKKCFEEVLDNARNHEESEV